MLSESHCEAIIELRLTSLPPSILRAVCLYIGFPNKRQWDRERGICALIGWDSRRDSPWEPYHRVLTTRDRVSLYCSPITWRSRSTRKTIRSRGSSSTSVTKAGRCTHASSPQSPRAVSYGFDLWRLSNTRDSRRPIMQASRALYWGWRSRKHWSCQVFTDNYKGLFVHFGLFPYRTISSHLSISLCTALDCFTIGFY